MNKIGNKNDKLPINLHCYGNLQYGYCRMKISAVIVLYNPDDDIKTNIDSYIKYVDKLYAIDNSVHKNDSLIEELKKNKKIKYIDNNGNRGIAHALNVGCNKAIENGYEWILTMDQDSAVTSNMLDNMLDYFVHVENINNISIIAPFHSNPYVPEYISNEIYSEVLITMTSGNLLYLPNYKQIGPFKEELFIDYVDNDYCLRSNLKGYKVVQVNNAILKHNLGELKQHKVLSKTFYSTNHSPIRRYYAFRNRVKIIKTYKRTFPEYCNFEKSRFFVDFIIVFLFEEEKFKKFKMMFLGIRDAIRNKYGKFND